MTLNVTSENILKYSLSHFNAILKTLHNGKACRKTHTEKLSQMETNIIWVNSMCLHC